MESLQFCNSKSMHRAFLYIWFTTTGFIKTEYYLINILFAVQGVGTKPENLITALWISFGTIRGYI